MAKVVVKFHDGDIWLHHFMTEGEAKAYVMGIRELCSCNLDLGDSLDLIKIDGKEV